MFYHIVLMNFVPECDQTFFATAEHYVQRIKAECDGVVSYFMTKNSADRSDGLTHGIVGIFASAAAHDAYQISPAHEEMKAFMMTGILRIVVLDADQGV